MEYIKIDPARPNHNVIRRAAEVLHAGGVIVYPTDTLYGLGVDAFNEKAVNKLYLLKQRNFKQPVSLMVNSIDEIEQMAGILPITLFALVQKILPGKITAILPYTRDDLIPLFRKFDPEQKIFEKIGFRIPQYRFCDLLTKQFGGAVSSTSANLSGKGNALNIPEVIAQFGDRIDLIIDAGSLQSLSGSTVIDFTKVPFLILREGEISLSALHEMLPGVEFKLKKKQFTITFVCSGNICRSPMAEVILKALIRRTRYRDLIRVNSAGTLGIEYGAAHQLAILAASEEGLDLSGHRPKGVNKKIMDEAEIVICMAVNHFDYLRKEFPDQRSKVILLKSWKREISLANPSVADPIGQSESVFRQTYREITIELKRILPYIFSEVKKFIEFNELSL
jgi:L-threonylcarbamoyladenylate synthase